MAFFELASTLDDIAAALEAKDVAATREALARARATEGEVLRWREALELGRETTRLAPAYWRARTHVERYAAAAGELELAVRNTRVLGRAAIRAVELEPELPSELPAAVRELAATVRELEAELAGRADGSEAVASALRAASLATHALDEHPNLSVGHLVGQVRSTATDLLRALGLEHAVAVERVRSAAERLPALGRGGQR